MCNIKIKIDQKRIKIQCELCLNSTCLLGAWRRASRMLVCCMEMAALHRLAKGGWIRGKHDKVKIAMHEWMNEWGFFYLIFYQLNESIWDARVLVLIERKHKLWTQVLQSVASPPPPSTGREENIGWKELSHKMSDLKSHIIHGESSKNKDFRMLAR